MAFAGGLPWVCSKLRQDNSLYMDVPRDGVNSVVYSPDGGEWEFGMLQRSRSGEIRLWDAVTGEHKQTLKGHTWEVNSVVYSPDVLLFSESNSRFVVDAVAPEKGEAFEP